MMPVHSSARRTSPTRSQAVSIEQNEMPAATGTDLTRRDRGEGRVEPCEPLAHPSLRHQRQAAVGHRLHLEVGVAELERDRQRPIGARQQRIDVGSIAGHVGELEIAPLDARPDPAEHRSGPFRPTLPGRDVAEHAHVQPGEIDRHPGRRAELTGVPEQTERRLPVAERIGGPIVDVVQTADDSDGRPPARRSGARPAPPQLLTSKSPAASASCAVPSNSSAVVAMARMVGPGSVTPDSISPAACSPSTSPGSPG